MEICKCKVEISYLLIYLYINLFMLEQRVDTGDEEKYKFKIYFGNQVNGIHCLIQFRERGRSLIKDHH